MLEYCSQYNNRAIDLTVRGLNPSRNNKFFFPKPSDGHWGPPSHLFNGCKVKIPGCEVNLSPPSVAEIKDEWSYNSTSPIHLYGMDRCAVKAEECLEIKLGEIQ